MDLYLHEPIGPFHTAVGASFASFTTRQDVSPQPIPLVQGYKLRPQAKIRVEADGEISSTATPTIVVGFYIGTVAGAITTVLAESSAITMSTAAAWPFRLEWSGIAVSTGVTGSVVGQGHLMIGTSLTAFSLVPVPITQALRTIVWDTTLPRAVGVCATWSASSASNTIRVNNHSLYIGN